MLFKQFIEHPCPQPDKFFKNVRYIVRNIFLHTYDFVHRMALGNSFFKNGLVDST